MKKTFLLLVAAISFLSCNSTVSNVFSKKKTPHEAYADKNDKNPELKKWVEVSTAVLTSALPVNLPYSHSGYFPAGKPRALALQFSARRGEKISFDLQKINPASPLIYADVFKLGSEEPAHMLAADTVDPAFSFEAEETGLYVLRLQPQLEGPVQYNLSISSGPSLGFPVAGKARVGGVWGDARDGGARSHEGIDIFAAKLTPAIAAADGYISRVNDGGLGGKTVSLRTDNRNLSLYYAHLDTQLVYEGQRVKKGDTVGLVGNTGNASKSSPHLHFGIYTYGGAVDPLPFVNKAEKKAPVPAPKNFNSQLKLARPLKTKTNQTIEANTLLTPLAITAAGYIAELPDGSMVETPFKSVQVINNKSRVN